MNVYEEINTLGLRAERAEAALARMSIDALRSEDVGNALATAAAALARAEAAEAALAQCLADRAMLRRALAQLVGVDTVEELRNMEMIMRAAPAPAKDKAAAIDAIHALIEVAP